MSVGKPTDHVRAAAEAVGALNHATIGGRGYVWPGDADDVIGELLLLAERLPQALGQVAGWLEAAHAAGRVGHDSDPAATGTAVVELLGDLERARRDAADLGLTLGCARENSAHLTGLAPTDAGGAVGGAV